MPQDPLFDAREQALLAMGNVRVGVAMLAALGVPLERVHELADACHMEQIATQLQTLDDSSDEKRLGARLVLHADWPATIMRETLALLGLRTELKRPFAALSPQWSRWAAAFRRLRERADARVRCAECGLEQAQPLLSDGGGCTSCGNPLLLRVH